jgi:hypothetical protein
VPVLAVKEQNAVTVGNDVYASGRLTDVGLSLSEWSRKALLGEGFGTRKPTGPDANARLLDDQWLGTLLETGYFGLASWRGSGCSCARPPPLPRVFRGGRLRRRL